MTTRYIYGENRKLTIWAGLRHQRSVSVCSVKATLALSPFCAAAIFLFGYLFEPLAENSPHGRFNGTNATLVTNRSQLSDTFASYDENDLSYQIWFFMVNIVCGLDVHFIWWAFTQRSRWGKSQTFIVRTIGCIIRMILFNGIICIVWFSRRHLKTVLSFEGLLAIFAGTEFIISGFVVQKIEFQSSFAEALVAGAVNCVMYLMIPGLIFLFISVNLGVEDEIMRAVVSGLLYPTAELALKYVYRNFAIRNYHGKGEGASEQIKHHAFIYLSRNLEIILGFPNIFLIFLLNTQSLFFLALLGSSLCEIGGLVVSNLRFSKPVLHIKRRITKATVLPSDDERVLTAKSLERKLAMDEFERVMTQKESLAIVRNCEELSEKALLFSVPIFICMFVSSGIIAQPVTSIPETMFRGLVAIALESVVDHAKLWIDAIFGVQDHLVANKMDIYDAFNIATVGFVALQIPLCAIVYSRAV